MTEVKIWRSKNGKSHFVEQGKGPFSGLFHASCGSGFWRRRSLWTPADIIECKRCAAIASAKQDKHD